MKRLLSWVTFFLLLLCTSCELFWEKPPSPTVYIVSIALDYSNTTQNLRELLGTINDATELQTVLSAVAGMAGYEKQEYLFLQKKDTNPNDLSIGGTTVNSYPSIANIEAAIAALQSLVKSNDLFIITFSGHGGEAGTIALGETESSTGIYPVSTLLQKLTPLYGRTLLILDSCYSGNAIAQSPSSLSTVYDSGIDDWYAKLTSNEIYTLPKIMMLTASADTYSYEETFAENHNHGVFSAALLEALGWGHPHPDAVSRPPARIGSHITIDSLYAYIKTHQVYPYEINLFKFWESGGVVQHPMTTGGAMDMVLFSF